MRPRIKKRNKTNQRYKNNNLKSFWINTFKNETNGRNYLKQEKIKKGRNKEHKIYQMKLTIFTDKGSIKCSGITISKGIRLVWVGWNNHLKQFIVIF